MKSPSEHYKLIFQDLIKKSCFPISAAELDKLKIYDFGLGNLREEGLGFIDLLSSTRLRITLLLLLPHQTLPQHIHPPYANEIGKEETIRVLYGQSKIYIEGKKNSEMISKPNTNKQHYTACHEIILNMGEQFTIAPNTQHWLQANEEGSVNLVMQNKIDETKNTFSNPNINGYKELFNEK